MGAHKTPAGESQLCCVNIGSAVVYDHEAQTGILLP